MVLLGSTTKLMEAKWSWALSSLSDRQTQILVKVPCAAHFKTIEKEHPEPLYHTLWRITLLVLRWANFSKFGFLTLEGTASPYRKVWGIGLTARSTSAIGVKNGSTKLLAKSPNEEHERLWQSLLWIDDLSTRASFVTGSRYCTSILACNAG